MSNENNNEINNAVGGVFGFIVMVGVLFYLFGGGFDKQVEIETVKFEKQVNDKVVADSLRQYEIVKRNGSEIESAVHAGFVAACYLQAGNESQYKRWKNIEKQHNKKAGIDY